MIQLDFIVLDIAILVIFFIIAWLFKKYVIGSLEDK